MFNTNLSFNDMPQALAYLIKKVEKIETTLEMLQTGAEPADRWMNVDEFCAYHPDHPAKQTVYDWVSYRKVPVHKDGKKLSLLKAEIDQWLGLGRQKTQAEIEQEAYDITRGRRNAR